MLVVSALSGPSVKKELLWQKLGVSALGVVLLFLLCPKFVWGQQESPAPYHSGTRINAGPAESQSSSSAPGTSATAPSSETSTSQTINSGQEGTIPPEAPIIDLQPPPPASTKPRLTIRGSRGGQAGLSFGAILPLSGEQAEKGQAYKAALEAAQVDLDEYLSVSGNRKTVAFTVEDSAAHPGTALEKLKALAASGLKVVFGPCSDAEVDAIQSFAQANGIVIISPSSAGPFLAKEDSIFRICPMNSNQALATSSMILQEGATTVVPIWKGDIYGDEMVVHLKGHVVNLGYKASPGVRYRPGTTNFQPFLAELQKQLDAAPGKKAVYIAAGEEIANIMAEAASIPSLGNVRWYGCDQTTMSPALTANSTANEFAMKVHFASPRYGAGGAPIYSVLEKRIQDKTGLFPPTESLALYDGVWVAALTGVACGGLDDTSKFRRAFPRTAEHSYGTTGWMALNKEGDRRSNWHYDFWGLTKESGKIYWDIVGRYQFEPGATPLLFTYEDRK